MKKGLVAFVFATVLVGMFSFTSSVAQSVYTVDATKSKIDWAGAAGDHYHVGTMAVKAGTVSVENGKIAGGKFTLDLTTIKSDAGEKLDGHLKSPDFFDASKLGVATFEIKSVKYTGDKTADIDGALTLKGITANVKFSAKVRGLDDKKLFAEASLSLDRTIWGIVYGPGMLANDITVNVHLFGTK